MDNFAELLTLLKQYLGIDDADTSRDAELTNYLRMAIQAAEHYIDNILDKREVTERWIDTRTPITLRYTPVGDLVRVEHKGFDDTTRWTLLYRDAFAVLSGGNSDGELLAVYEAGYATLPYDLMLALVYAATTVENQQGRGAIQSTSGGAVKKESIVGVGSIDYDVSGTTGGVSAGADAVGILPTQSIEILNLYKRMHA